jgi:hypothetical protein
MESSELLVGKNPILSAVPEELFVNEWDGSS